MKTPPQQKITKGFTLIELLVVVAIIAILAAISVGGFGYISKKQAYNAAELQISLLSKALEEYKLDNGDYPDATNSNELYRALYWDGASVDPPEKIYIAELDPDNNRQNWTSGNNGNVRIMDPWGEEYIYRIGSDPSARNPDFDLVSGGPDGQLNTEGDNVSNFN